MQNPALENAGNEDEGSGSILPWHGGVSMVRGGGQGLIGL